MGESCTIYVSNRELCPVHFLEEQAGGADVRVTPGIKPDTWSAVEVRWRDVRLTLNHRDNVDAQLAPHLRGFCEYVWDVVGRQMDQRVWALQRKVHKTKHLLGIVGMPGFDDKAAGLIHRFAEANHGLIFRDSSVYDSSGRLYLGKDGDHDRDAVLPEPPSALARKARTEEQLRQRRIAVNEALPAADADEEAVLQPPANVAWRAVALCAVAARGEGLEQEKAIGFLQQAGLWLAATPRERAFLENPQPSRQDTVQFTWRYECLRVLLWALGYVDDAGFPGAVCDVPRAVRLVLDTPIAELVGKAALRPADDVLDLLDVTYRCHWAVQDARLKGQPLPAGIEPGVAQERHVALNWLTCYRNQDWDDVTTDT